MKKNLKITVVGSGYVGLSLSVLLSQHNDVTILDVDHLRVNKINKRKSTISDDEIELFLAQKPLSLFATLDKKKAFQDANFIIIATPTNYDDKKNYFDTSSVDSVIEDALSLNDKALIVIKSTIPVGHTNFLQKKFNTNRITFSPEFLREGRALKDNLFPSRIIIGSFCESSVEFSNLLKRCSKKPDVNTIFMSSKEAEAVKLFSNTYLAMRVAFFNELDSFAYMNNIDTESIISGVCSDDRIGQGYNNPSFGYGGYCLPKDTKQLLAGYKDIPQNIIEAVVESNATRIKFLVDEIIKQKPRVVGFFRLVMKEGSDNFRESATLEILKKIYSQGTKVILHEPLIEEHEFMGFRVVNDIKLFKHDSDLIVANRFAKCLIGEESKLFTRDIYHQDI